MQCFCAHGPTFTVNAESTCKSAYYQSMYATDSKDGWRGDTVSNHEGIVVQGMKERRPVAYHTGCTKVGCQVLCQSTMAILSLSPGCQSAPSTTGKFVANLIPCIAWTTVFRENGLQKCHGKFMLGQKRGDDRKGRQSAVRRAVFMLRTPSQPSSMRSRIVPSGSNTAPRPS